MNADGMRAASGRGRQERLADLGLLALFSAIVLLAWILFHHRGSGPESRAHPAPAPGLSPNRLYAALGTSQPPERGEQLYRVHCLPCHGADGNLGLAGARRFGREPFRNTRLGAGAHPLSLFDTLANGFGAMVPQTHLSVADRIAIIRFLREKLVRPQNPGQYVPLPDPPGRLDAPERTR